MYNSGSEHNCKLKISMQTRWYFDTLVYCHNNVNVLYSEDGNVYRPILKYKTATMFFFSKAFSRLYGLFGMAFKLV